MGDHLADQADWPLSGPAAPSIRRRLENAIEALIAQLDELDDDPDLEDTGDERDASIPEWSRATRGSIDAGWHHFPGEDMEDGGDHEPSLGWAANTVQVTQLDTDGGRDLEKDAGDERETSWHECPDQTQISSIWPEDDEPWLGSPEAEVFVPLADPFGRARRGRGKLPRQRRSGEGTQEHWARFTSEGEEDAGEQPEEENEHGGDILDEPHDFAFSSVCRVAAMPAMPYRAHLDGRCLEPFIADGSLAIVDPQRPFRPGDLICVNRRAAAVPKGDHHSLAKVFGGECDGFVYLWMTNPPSILRLRAADILSMHRIVSVTQPNGHVFAPESVLPRLSQIIGIPHLA